MGTSDQIQHRAEELGCCCPAPNFITAQQKEYLLEIYEYVLEHDLFSVTSNNDEENLSSYNIEDYIQASDYWTGWHPDHKEFVSKIISAYGGSSSQMVLIPKGSSAKIHIDSHPLRRCVVSIPLSAMDAPLNFYNQDSFLSPEVSIFYNRPTLLNIGQWYHEVPACSTDRIMLQVSFGETYQTVKEKLYK